MATDVKAKGIQRGGAAVGPPLDDFRPDLAAQVHDSLARILARWKAEEVAARVDRKRSTVYRWLAEPADVPVSALAVLIEMDPDPELAARLAGIISTQASSRALAREAAGRTRIIVEEIAPGRWGR